MNVRVSFPNKLTYLNIEERDGRIVITVDPSASPNIPIVVLRNSGAPGVCGPHMVYDMKEINDAEVQKAVDAAYRDGGKLDSGST